ncbi:MAG: ArsI/CadI family heavy metal resistance metalloenzyme, partial [Ilumatobacteraceae bacterium]
MSRLQLALNVDNLEESIAHYTKIFGVGPAKVRPGYANFAVVNPPLKLVLIENPGASDSINHLGVEVESVDAVRSEHERVTAAGLPVWVEGETTCCYAVQDKFWVEGGKHQFEVYTVLADADVMKGATTSVAPAATTSGAATSSGAASVATTSGAAVCCAPQPQT